MVTSISRSAEETQRIAEDFARRLPFGTVVGLIGDLGAGKTQFVKGLARGLGISEPVLSPTFALLHVYSSGRLPLYHLDLYRLESHADILAAGLDDYLSPAGITVVEWWDRWQGNPPLIFRKILLEVLSESERQISYVDPGA